MSRKVPFPTPRRQTFGCRSTGSDACQTGPRDPRQRGQVAQAFLRRGRRPFHKFHNLCRGGVQLTGGVQVRGDCGASWPMVHPAR
jgi:hypothetical protein